MHSFLKSELGTSSVTSTDGIQMIERALENMIKNMQSNSTSTCVKMGLKLSSLISNKMKKNVIEAIILTAISEMKKELPVEKLKPLLALLDTSLERPEVLQMCMEVLFWAIVPELFSRLCVPATCDGPHGAHDVDQAWQALIEAISSAAPNSLFKDSVTVADVMSQVADGAITNKFLHYLLLDRMSAKTAFRWTVKIPHLLFGKSASEFIGNVLKGIQPSQIVPGISDEVARVIER
jgi:hypothetical protein